MSPRRRALVLGGLALLLGALAVSDVAGREAALRRSVGPLTAVLVAREPIARGAVVQAGALAVRRVPARYAPQGRFTAAAQVTGARTAVAIPPGADLHPALLAGAEEALAAARPGERITRIIAVGSADELPPGTRADILITRDAGDGARTRLALAGAEVVGARAAPGLDAGEAAGLPRVALALRVTVRQAVLLTEAQADARELRALPRPG
ncbi:MAG: SAF domain-containing protein [Solirubrobacteraceae bacterium]|jgi:pilus assembly protein CpaB|nr:SAF domain-containing protein [Solirubrobacteraceae bacterium]